jgi:hypothetical protein
MAKHHGEHEIKAALEAAQAAFKRQQHLRTSLSAAYQQGEKAKTAKILEALGENTRRVIANRRQAQELVAFKHPIVTPVPLLTAYAIEEAPPGGFPFSPHAEASNNVVNTFFERGIDTASYGDAVYVEFWFNWQSPTDYDAVINNISSSLVLFGTCQATANSHVVHNGEAGVTLYAKFGIYSGNAHWMTGVSIADFYVRGNHDTGAPNTQGGVFSDIYPVSLGSSPWIVPAGEQVFFVVQFEAAYRIHRGQVNFDFNAPGNFMMCPGVQMDLRTSPQIESA